MPKRIHVSKMLGGQDIGSKSTAIRNKLIKKVIVLVLAFLIVGVFCVWSRVRIVQLGYEISALQKELAGLIKEESHSRIEVERLKSPAHLQKVATEILNMHPPRPSEIVSVKKR